MGEATSWQMPSFDDLLPNAGAAPAAAPPQADDAAAGWQMPSFDDLMPEQSLPAAVGKSLVRGAIVGTGRGIEGLSRTHLAADKGYANTMLRAVEALASDESAAYRALTQMQRGVLTAYRRATPERQAEMQAEWHSALTQGTPAMVDAGTAITEYGEGVYVDPRQEGDLTGAANMLGAFVPALPAAAIGAVAGGPVGGIAGMTAVMWGQAYSSTRERAKEKGATEDQAAEIATKNAFAQVALNVLPLSRVLKYMPDRLRGKFVQTVAEIGRSGVEFASAGALGTLAENFIIREEIDPNQSLTEGVWANTKSSAIVGAVIPGAAMTGRGAGRVARNQLGQAASPEFRADLDRTERLAAEAQPTIAPEVAPVDGLPPEIPGGEPSTPAQGTIPLQFDPNIPTMRITPEPEAPDGPLPAWQVENAAAIRDLLAKAPAIGEQIKALHGEGKTASEIAAELGGGWSTNDIRAARDALGLVPHGPAVGLLGKIPEPEALPDGVPEGPMQETLPAEMGRPADDVAPAPDAVFPEPIDPAAMPPPMADPGRPRKPPSLFDFLISKGGIKPDGDLLALGLETVHHQRAGRLLNKNGMTVDRAREVAAHYLRTGRDDGGRYGERTEGDVADFYNALAEEHAGRPVYPPEYASEANEWAQGRAADRERIRGEELAVEARAAAEESGVRLTPDEEMHAARLMVEGARPEEAVYEAVRASDVERTQAYNEARGMLSVREKGQADQRAVGAPSPEAGRARQELAVVMQRLMRQAGLPSSVGLKLVDRLVDAEGNAADASYARSLVTFALDTPAREAPVKLFHEVTHALMDPQLGVLTQTQRNALLRAADRWLAQAGNREGLADLRYTPEQMREEAVARVAEEVLARARQEPPITTRAVEAMNRAVEAIGSGLRGQGFWSADGVFRAVMQGRVKGEGKGGADGSPQYARRPGSPVRRRGAEAIISRLNLEANKRRAEADRGNGPRVHPDEIREVDDFIRFVGEDLVRDVGLSVRKGDLPQLLGQFNGADRIVTVFESALLSGVVPRTMVHELWHSLERLVPLDQRRALGREFVRAKERWVREHDWARPFDQPSGLTRRVVGAEADAWLTRNLGNQEAMSSVRLEKLPTGGNRLSFAANEDSYRFTDRSEYFAESLTDRFYDRQFLQDEKARSVVGHFRGLWQRIKDAFKRIWGDGATAQTFGAFERGDFQRATPDDQNPFMSNDPRYARRPLPESLDPQLPAAGGSKENLEKRNVGILSAEVTAHAARFTSPEGREYGALLDAQRQAWSRVDWLRASVELDKANLRDPSLTDRGAERKYGTLQRNQAKLENAEASAAALGVDPDAPFPGDARMDVPFGEFPGDREYAHESYAPEGFPFPDLSVPEDKRHQYHDPRHRVRQGDTPADESPLYARRPPKPPPSGPDLFGGERREPEQRAAVPTYRNDPRQEAMPGMEPSAVQAQAARDQTGRGGLEPRVPQARPNEGLFAPKAPEEGTLFSRRPARQPNLNLARSAWEIEDPGLVDSFLRTMQDNKIDLNKVQKRITDLYGPIPESRDAYAKEELYHGRVSSRVQRLHDQRVKPILRQIAGNREGVTVDDVDRYLLARHAPERNAAMKAINPDRVDNEALSGMSDADAAAAMQAFAGESKLNRLEAIAKDVDKLTADTRKVIKAEGLETADTIKAWEDAYQFYAPLQRDIEGNGAPTGSGFNVRGPESKRSMGSTLEVKNILANIVAQAETAAIRAEKNKVTTALADLAKQYPADGFWKVDEVPTTRQINKDTGLVEVIPDPLYQLAPNVVMYKEGGKHHFIEFNEKNKRAVQVARAMKNMDAGGMSAVMRMATVPTRFLASLLTRWNPEFWVTNFIRDVGGTQYNWFGTGLKEGRRDVIANVPKAMRGLRDLYRGEGNSEWAGYAKEMDAAGGTTGHMDMYETSDKRMDNLRSEVAKMEQGAGDPRRIARTVLQAVDDYNSIVENSVRLAAFQAARKQGLSPQRAASIAKNITVNFNRKGNASAGINAWFMFFNASVQGTATILKAAAKSPKARAVLGGMAVTGFLLDMVNREVMGEDYEAIPDFEKSHNAIFAKSDGSYVKVPYPLGLNAVFNVGRLTSEAISGRSHKKPIEYGMSMAAAMLDAFNPMGSVGGMGEFFSPSVARPIVQLADNRSFTGAPVFKSGDRGPRGDAPEPAHRRHFQNTPGLWIAASRGMNALTGGDYAEKGAVDVSPDALRHIFTSMTGGMGRAADRTLDYFTSDEPSASRMPFVGRVVGKVDDRMKERAYMGEAKRINTAINEVDFLLKSGRPEAADDIIKKLGKGNLDEGFRILGSYRAAKKELDTLRRKEAPVRMTEPTEEDTAIIRMMLEMRRQSMGRALREGRP